MLAQALSAARDVGRLHEIAGVLVRHGLGEVVQRLGIARLLARAGRALHWSRVESLPERSPAERFRAALEEMGPTFVKAGQILAGRRDLLPQEWTDELSRLHQSAATVPFEEIRAQLAEDLGAPPEEVFDDLAPVPLAAASIAQVHTATTRGGKRVVLKVRRPGIEPVVDADLRLLGHLAQLLESEVPELRHLRPTRLARQISRSLRSELDLRIEARAAERLRKQLPEDSCLRIPHFHPQWTHERLCVMERLDGPTIGEWTASPAFDPDEGRRLASLGARDAMRMMLVDGYFHADPHPGNLVLLADGRLGLLDFGMMGRLGEERRLELLQLLLHVSRNREEEAADVLLAWCADGNVDIDALRADVAALLDRHGDRSLVELDLGALLGDVTRLLRENGLFLPEDVALLIKALLTLEDLGRRLDPQFQLTRAAEPFARQALRRERSPRALLRRGRRALARLAVTLPSDLRRILEHARRGRLHVEIEVKHLEALNQQLSRSANRITVGLVTSALIVGTSIALTVPSPGAEAFGLPLFAFLGFASSLVAGAWLLVAIWRAGRR